MLKKIKRKISFLLMVFVLMTIIPTSVFAATTSSPNADNAISSGDFQTYFNTLTTWINQQTGTNFSADTLKNKLSDADFAKTLAQWQLIKQTGAASMSTFASAQEHKNFLTWLMNDTSIMNTFLEGGKPSGNNPVKSLEIWEEIWKTDATSRSSYLLKLAMATGLAHASPITVWYSNGNVIDPIARYNHFKTAEQNNQLAVSLTTRDVWDMRMIVDSWASDWDLQWLRDKFVGKYNSTNGNIGFSYPPYIDKSPLKDANGNPYSIHGSAANFYGPDATIKTVFEYGGVCGTASRFGSQVYQAFGIPAMPVGQPGHCAYVFLGANRSWGLGYDVFGWGQSTQHGGTTTPFGNFETNAPAYIFAYEEARSNAAALSQAERLRWLADAQSSITNSQAVRKASMAISPVHMNVWKDYIAGMRKTLADFEQSYMILPSQMTATDTSHQDSTCTAAMAIDGNKDTIWHTKWSGNPLPQSITITLSVSNTINRLNYLPRQAGNSNGNITAYNIYTSTDGTNFTKVASGTWANDRNEKTAEFAPVSAKYVKLEATEGAGNLASASEIRLYKPLGQAPILESDWRIFANSILSTFVNHPRAALNLFNSIKDKVVYTGVDRKAINDYIVAFDKSINQATDGRQKQIAEMVKSDLLSQGLYLATFSFDGENAGKLMGIKTDVEYSLDGGNSFKRSTSNDMALSSTELASITAANGIRLRVVGCTDSIKLAVKTGATASGVSGDDELNKVLNIDATMEFSTDTGLTWTRYNAAGNLPDLSGDVTLLVRKAATGITLSGVPTVVTFTTMANKELIPASKMTATDTGHQNGEDASKAIDGNTSTLWHTNYNKTDILPQSITIALESNMDVALLEYIPRQDGGSYGGTNGIITEYRIYVSDDGIDFTEVSGGFWPNNKNRKAVLLDSVNTKYIKFEAVQGVGGFASAAEVKLYKDLLAAPKVSFSFDGGSAGKLMGITAQMEYSLDGGKTYKSASAADMTLSSTELASINEESNIKVRVIGSTKYSNIDIIEGPTTPNVTGDNARNIITGMDTTMEFRTNNGSTWTKYNNNLPSLTGDMIIRVRKAATGVTLAGTAKIIVFTSRNEINFDSDAYFRKLDINKDGNINKNDLDAITEKYNTNNSSTSFDKNYDITDDNCVDIFDITKMARFQ